MVLSSLLIKERIQEQVQLKMATKESPPALFSKIRKTYPKIKIWGRLLLMPLATQILNNLSSMKIN